MKNSKHSPMSWSGISNPLNSNQHFVGALIGAGASLLGAGVQAIGAKKQRETQEKMQMQQMQMAEENRLSKIPPGSEGVVPGVANPYMLALGGLSQANVGSENRLTEYEGGGTHEQNPLGGIPIGADQQGTPNTVEEGESSFNFEDGKYIFSNRLFL